VRAAGSRGRTCKSCLKVKQKCEAVWGGGDAVGPSGFPALGEDAMRLLERLVVGVEKVGTEVAQVNARLGRIEEVLWKSALEEGQEIVDQGLHHSWFSSWKEGEMDEEVKELEEENRVFRAFLRSREAESEEESGGTAEEGDVVGAE
jgi:hypothetical protein